jgi:hypothetical protein
MAARAGPSELPERSGLGHGQVAGAAVVRRHHMAQGAQAARLAIGGVWRMPVRGLSLDGEEESVGGLDAGSESPRDHKRLARQAGLGRLSFISVLAGVLVAYGAFVVLAAVVGAVAVAIGLDTELAGNDWASLGRGSAVTVTVVAFVAYLFGGYVAGRMARRAGLVNGLAVFVLALVLVVVVGAIVASQADAIQANLRSLGLPVTGTEWARIGTVAGIGTLVGMLVGAGIGGMVGERWHGELARWAAVGRGRPDGDQDDHDQASQAPERRPERDIKGDRPAGDP